VVICGVGRRKTINYCNATTRGGNRLQRWMDAESNNGAVRCCQNALHVSRPIFSIKTSRYSIRMRGRNAAAAAVDVSCAFQADTSFYLFLSSSLRLQCLTHCRLCIPNYSRLPCSYEERRQYIYLPPAFHRQHPNPGSIQSKTSYRDLYSNQFSMMYMASGGKNRTKRKSPHAR